MISSFLYILNWDDFRLMREFLRVFIVCLSLDRSLFEFLVVVLKFFVLYVRVIICFIELEWFIFILFRIIAWFFFDNEFFFFRCFFVGIIGGLDLVFVIIIFVFFFGGVLFFDILRKVLKLLYIRKLVFLDLICLMLFFDIDIGFYMLDIVLNGFFLGFFWVCWISEILFLFFVVVECFFDRLGGGIGVVWDSVIFDEIGGEDGDDDDGDDEVKMEDKVFSGFDFFRLLFFWNDDYLFINEWSIYFKKKIVYICFKKKFLYEVLILNKFKVKEIM